MASLEALHDKLDDLWAQYLSLTSEYQEAQREVQSLLSTAYFALAQANFNKPSGRRYGRDYYDQRAVASIRAEINVSSSGSDADASGKALSESKGGEQDAQRPLPSTSVRLIKPSRGKGAASQSRTAGSPATAAETEVEANTESYESEKTELRPKITVEQLLTPEATPEPPLEGVSDEAPPPAEHTVADSNDEKGDAIVEPEPEAPQPTDPLRSFAGGVLIPPALRKTQKCFLDLFVAESVDDDVGAKGRPAIVNAINAARAMRGLEAEIRKLRKTIRKVERDAKAID